VLKFEDELPRSTSTTTPLCSPSPSHETNKRIGTEQRGGRVRGSGNHRCANSGASTNSCADSPAVVRRLLLTCCVVCLSGALRAAWGRDRGMTKRRQRLSRGFVHTGGKRTPNKQQRLSRRKKTPCLAVGTLGPFHCVEGEHTRQLSTLKCTKNPVFYAFNSSIVGG